MKIDKKCLLHTILSPISNPESVFSSTNLSFSHPQPQKATDNLKYLQLLSECPPLSLESDEDGGHVISAYAVGGVHSDYVLEHVAHAFRQFCIGAWGLHITVEFINTFLVLEAIPNSITGQNNELVPVLSCMLLNLWESCNSLILRLQIILIFVLEISESSTQGKIAVHSGVLHKVLCLFNSVPLPWVVRFVIDTQGDCFS